MAEHWECWAPWAVWHRPPVSPVVVRYSEPHTRERRHGFPKRATTGRSHGSHVAEWLQVYQRWRWHHLQPLDLISHRLRWARSQKSLNGFGQDWGVAMPGNLGNFQHLAVDLGGHQVFASIQRDTFCLHDFCDLRRRCNVNTFTASGLVIFGQGWTDSLRRCLKKQTAGKNWLFWSFGALIHGMWSMRKVG